MKGQMCAKKAVSKKIAKERARIVLQGRERVKRKKTRKTKAMNLIKTVNDVVLLCYRFLWNQRVGMLQLYLFLSPRAAHIFTVSFSCLCHLQIILCFPHSIISL